MPRHHRRRKKASPHKSVAPSTNKSSKMTNLKEPWYYLHSHHPKWSISKLEKRGNTPEGGNRRGVHPPQMSQLLLQGKELTQHCTFLRTVQMILTTMAISQRMPQRNEVAFIRAQDKGGTRNCGNLSNQNRFLSSDDDVDKDPHVKTKRNFHAGMTMTENVILRSLARRRSINKRSETF